MTFFAFFQNRFMVPICVFLDAKWHLVISLHFKECEFTIFQTKKKIVKKRGGGGQSWPPSGTNMLVPLGDHVF